MHSFFRRLLLASLGALTLVSTALASRPLNNLVTELVAIEFPAGEEEPMRRVTFEMPAEGWVHLSARPKPGSTGKITLTLDDGSEPVLVLDESTPLPETMRRLPAGSHTLEILPEANAALAGLTVRAVPQIIFYSIDHLGQDRWNIDFAVRRDYRELWDQGILPNFNILVSEPYASGRHDDTAAYADLIREWRGQGRQWLVKVSAAKKKGEDPAEVEALWAKPLADPRIDGIMIDECSRYQKELFPFWGREIEALSRRPEVQGKSLYALCGFAEAEKTLLPLTQGVVGGGYYMAPEMYFRNLARLERAPADMVAWRKAYPGVEKNFIAVLGPNNAATGLTFHVQPDYNYKAFLEKQMAMLATDPAFAGIAGVGIWVARYMDDDLLRWYARLVRHYLIEGQSTPMGTDPVLLTHLQNPGFEDGEAGWTLEKASPDSLSVRDASIVPYIKRSYSALPERKKVLYTKRDPERPNRISQTVRDLIPGRVYHVDVYTQDLNCSDKPADIAIGIQLNGAEILPEHSFDKTIVSPAKSSRTQDDGLTFEVETGDLKMAWLHSRRLFRATAPTAELVLSDWPGDKPPAGGAGQELVWDFIELAPDVSLEPVLPQSLSQSK